MLRPESVGLIERLLAEGRWSQRQIARRADVSRFTVRRIARGERTSRARSDHSQRARASAGDPDVHPVGRCRGCGALVELPCRACQVRALKVRGEG